MYGSPRAESAMTAKEWSVKWIAELEEVERMTPTQLRQGLRKLAGKDDFCGHIARAVLAKVGDAH